MRINAAASGTLRHRNSDPFSRADFPSQRGAKKANKAIVDLREPEAISC
jgi:hypothetical protein